MKLTATALVLLLAASATAVPTHLRKSAAAWGKMRGMIHGVQHLPLHHEGAAYHLAVALDPEHAAEPRFASSKSKAKGPLNALADFGTYEASVLFDTAAVDKLGLTPASDAVQGYFNAVDDLGVTDVVVGGVEDTIDEIKRGKKTDLELQVDLADKSEAQLEATAMHLGCAIHLSYWKSDMKFFKNKLVTGFGIMLKVIKNLVMVAMHLAKAIYMALKSQGKNKIISGIDKVFSYILGDGWSDQESPKIEKAQKSLSERLKEGFTTVKGKVKDGIKALKNWRNLMVALDLIYHVTIEAVFPKALRDRIGMAATVIASMIPGKLSTAQSRCMACLLAAPPVAQLALVRAAKAVGNEVCHMKVGSHSGPLGALFESESADSTELPSSIKASELSDSLSQFLNADASKFKGEPTKTQALMGARLALSKVNAFLNGPMTTMYDMAKSETRDEAFGMLEVTPERREMATGYFGDADWEVHAKFLEMFKAETVKTGMLARYERNTEAHMYAVQKVNSHADMKTLIGKALTFAQKQTMSTSGKAMIKAIGKALVSKVRGFHKGEAAQLDQLAQDGYQASNTDSSSFSQEEFENDFAK